MVDKILLDHFREALNLQNNLEIFLECLGKKRLGKNWTKQVVAIYGLTEDPEWEHDEALDVDISDDQAEDSLILSPVDSGRYCAVVKVKEGYRIYHTFDDDEEQYMENYPDLEEVIWALLAMYPHVPDRQKLFLGV